MRALSIRERDLLTESFAVTATEEEVGTIFNLARGVEEEAWGPRRARTAEGVVTAAQLAQLLTDLL